MKQLERTIQVISSQLLLCRTNNEKEYSGIPDIPRRDRLIELEYASVTDRKIRGQLRNVDAIEKQASAPAVRAMLWSQNPQAKSCWEYS